MLKVDIFVVDILFVDDALDTLHLFGTFFVVNTGFAFKTRPCPPPLSMTIRLPREQQGGGNKCIEKLCPGHLNFVYIF
jgi:hypothetical protein